MEKGYMYLCAIIDWHSRYILSWGISNTHDSEFCQELLNEAIAKHGVPEIFNIDQGSEFTVRGFVDILKNTESKSAWMEKEELWITFSSKDFGEV